MYAHYICKVELCITVITSFCLVNSHQDRLPHMPLEIVIDDPIGNCRIYRSTQIKQELKSRL